MQFYFYTCILILIFKLVVTIFCFNCTKKYRFLIIEFDLAIIDLYQPEKVLSLEAGVTKFFQDNNRFGVLTAKGICVAIWKLDMYYMFDPDSRGPCGVNMLNGTACITRFTSPQKLVDVLKQNLEKGDDKFFLFNKIFVN